MCSVHTRYDDQAMVTIPRSCPASLLSPPNHTFKIRAVFENPAGMSDFFNGSLSALAELAATAEFSNGSRWRGAATVTMYPTALTTETGAHRLLHGLECLGGWRGLPSGRQLCYVQLSRAREARREVCRGARATLAELGSRADAQAFLYMMHSTALSSTASLALGAVARGGAWVWEASGEEVSLCSHGCLLTTSTDTTPSTDSSLYMDLVNSPEPGEEFMSGGRQFALVTRAGPASEETYFLCMREGEGSAAEAPTLTVRQDPPTLHRLDLAALVFTLKVPRGAQFPFTLRLHPDKDAKVCKLELTHVGANLPSLVDPAHKYRSPYNTSRIHYGSEDSKKAYGSPATISFNMVSNWGRSEN